jgi:diketogulonate reductase-like aldo/keto reductase
MRTVDFTNLEAAFDISLKAVQKEYIDVYLLHRPGLNLNEARDA